MKETLGQRLQRLRMAANLTQRLLAEAAGVPLSTLQNWEIDRREPGLRPAVRLAEALGVSVNELADTIPVDEVGKVPRPAGPSKRGDELRELAPVKKIARKGKEK